LGEQVRISKEYGLVSVDRSRAGSSYFHRDFAASFSAPMSWKAEKVRIFLDASSIELFVNDGELAITALLFPSQPWNKVSLLSGASDLEIFDLKK
jgi:fructan beta-fructosidase